ncbi:DUF5753 domain-containing protein [Actinomadura kijaniata]|uniref:DUF5753 domain-containing protein n=1 Tax=Actinomadura kijaniata TaxID=46161 RepID=UPI003F1CDC26
MSDDDCGSSIAAVISLLCRNRDIAGRPSFDAIERISKDLEERNARVAGVTVERLAKSTVYDLLTQPRRRIPRWRQVELLWAVLVHIAHTSGRPTADMVPLAQIEGHYRQLVQRPSMPGRRAASPPAGTPLARTPAGGDQVSAPLASSAPGGSGLEAAGALLAGLDPAGPHTPASRVLAVQQLLKEAGQRTQTAWWSQYADLVPSWFRAYLSVEPELSEIWTFAPYHLPGLLQIDDYARHIIAADLPDIGDRERERRVRLRMDRQHILRRPDPPVYWAVTTKRALCPPHLPPGVRRAQIKHLITMASYQNITLQIIDPRIAERIHCGPMTVMRFAEPGYGDAVYLEQPGRGFYQCEGEDVAYHNVQFSRLANKARQHHETVALLLDLFGRLQP